MDEYTKAIITMVFFAVVLGLSFGEKERFHSVLAWTAIVSIFVWAC